MYSSSANSLSPEAGSMIAGILVGLLAFAAILIPIAIVLYILGSLGRMKIAEREKEPSPWIAWIPFASSYLVCKLAFRNKNLALAYAIVPGVLSIFSRIFKDSDVAMVFSILIGIVSFAIWIMGFAIAYKIYARYSQNAVGMLIGTILTLGLLEPIFMFAIRNNPRIDEESEIKSVEQ